MFPVIFLLGREGKNRSDVEILNMKSLGLVRVNICKNILAMSVPVDLSCYILGRRWTLKGIQKKFI
jgi:hypothetical protein